MTGEIIAAASLGLAFVCPGAAALAGLGYLAGQVAGEEYRSAIRDADSRIKREFEGSSGEAANRAAKSTTSLAETLAPWTFGASAAWMGVRAYQVRERMREVAVADLRKKSSKSTRTTKKVTTRATTRKKKAPMKNRRSTF